MDCVFCVRISLGALNIITSSLITRSHNQEVASILLMFVVVVVLKFIRGKKGYQRIVLYTMLFFLLPFFSLYDFFVGKKLRVNTSHQSQTLMEGCWLATNINIFLNEWTSEMETFDGDNVLEKKRRAQKVIFFHLVIALQPSIRLYWLEFTVNLQISRSAKNDEFSLKFAQNIFNLNGVKLSVASCWFSPFWAKFSIEIDFARNRSTFCRLD